MQFKYVDRYLITHILPPSLVLDVVLSIWPVMTWGVWQFLLFTPGQSISIALFCLKEIKRTRSKESHLLYPTIVESIR